jgi:hypothetical protein
MIFLFHCFLKQFLHGTILAEKAEEKNRNTKKNNAMQDIPHGTV